MTAPQYSPPFAPCFQLILCAISCAQHSFCRVFLLVYVILHHAPYYYALSITTRQKSRFFNNPTTPTKSPSLTKSDGLGADSGNRTISKRLYININRCSCVSFCVFLFQKITLPHPLNNVLNRRARRLIYLQAHARSTFTTKYIPMVLFLFNRKFFSVLNDIQRHCLL